MTDQEKRLTQGLKISSEADTTGFDLSAGSKWIYPENYPLRDYQFTIVETALYNNTLVCLPTGLGKTFIAAVVMYNFWRWYPQGKVVFLAPTKPLVAQQIDACHGIMGIPSAETIELTGTVNQTKRQTAWSQKRVIFATPQTFQNDLQKEIVPCELIKCVVFDEAHKALGKHSYCEIIRLINLKNKFFRVLALSATPGSKIDHVREVIQNLQISQLELRDDMSPDITPYSNAREIQTIVVGLNPELAKFKERYIFIMDPHVKTLIQNNILRGDTANISRGRIFLLMNDFKSKSGSANHGHIMKTFTILISMYHAYELLIRNGPRSFLTFFQNHADKWWINKDPALKELLIDIENYLGIFPVVSPMPDGSIPDIPPDLVFGHNKFKKLQELLLRHFNSFNDESRNTRAIVFVEYRDTVNEVYLLLLNLRPLIRPQIFVGQAGLKQKQQMKALDDFRNNKVNVLISTSVGEEGLDVGEVDLIICFDISSSAPTRLVQRMGRTGRKRNGSVIVLVTEGKEMQTFKSAMSKKDSLNRKVLESSNIVSCMYPESPRMIPEQLQPTCYKMFIKAQLKTPKSKGKATKAPIERKKKRSEKLNEDDPPNTDFVQPSTSKSHSTITKKQPSLMSFFTEKKSNESFTISSQKRNNDKVFSQQILIKPSNVKLLSSNEEGFEFLTLCATKNSEKETDDGKKVKVDLTYIPVTSDHDSDIFSNFTVPMMDVLNCLSMLSEEPEKTKKVEIITVNEGETLMDYQELQDSQIFQKSFQPEITVESKYRPMEVVTTSPAYVEAQFEDLLDEESDANSETGKLNGNIEKDMFEHLLNDSDGDDSIADVTVISNDRTVIPEISCVSSDSTNFSDEFCTIIEGDDGKIKGVEKSKIKNEDSNELEYLDDDVMIIEHRKRLGRSEEVVRCAVGNGLYDIDDENAWDISSFFEGLRKSSQMSNENEVSVAERVPMKKFNIHGSENSRNIKNNFPGKSNIFKGKETSLACINEKKSAFECSREENSSEETPALVNRTEMGNVGKENLVDVSDIFRDFDKSNLFRNEEIDLGSFHGTNENKTESNSVMHQEYFIDSDEDLFASFEKDDADSANFNMKAEPAPEPEPKPDEKEETCNLYDAKNDETFFESESESEENRLKVKENHESDRKSPINEMAAQNIDDLIFDIDNWDSDFADSPKAVTNVVNRTKSSNDLNSNLASDENSSTGWISVDTKNDSGRVSLKRKFSDSTLPLRKKPHIEEVLNQVEKEPKEYQCFFAQNTSPSFSKVFKKQNSKRCLSLLVSEQNFNKKVTFTDLSNRMTETNFEEFDSDKVIIKCTNAKYEILKPDVKSFDSFTDFVVPKEPKPKPDKTLLKNHFIPTPPKVRLSLSEKLRRAENKENENGKTLSKSSSQRSESKRKRDRKKSKLKKKKNEFIAEEAEVSSDAETSEGSSGGEEYDDDLEDFVSYTQHISEEVDMRAYYLQALKSPKQRPGAFLFKEIKDVPMEDIYSQVVSHEDNTYLQDSFCVNGTEDESDSEKLTDETFLGQIEPVLENRKRITKGRKLEFDAFREKRQKMLSKKGQQRRQMSDESSEDEAEILRRQVLEESILLRKPKPG